MSPTLEFGHVLSGAVVPSPPPTSTPASSTFRPPLAQGILPAGIEQGVEIRKAIEKEFASVKGSMVISISEALEPTIGTIVGKVCANEFKRIDGRLDNMEHAQGVMGRDIGEIKAMMAGFSQKLSLQHSGSLPTLGTPQASQRAREEASHGHEEAVEGFFRMPSKTLLLCNTHDSVFVSAQSFHDAIEVLAGECNLKSDMFVISGDNLDCKFEIQFQGDLRTATSRCMQFLQSLSLGKGRWKSQRAVGPDPGSQVQYYVGPDKNPAQVLREILAKKLKGILAPLMPGKEIYIRKSTGSLFVDRRCLVSIRVLAENVSNLTWSPSLMILHKLEQGPIQEDFNLTCGMGQSP
jgi:hypothetical protein